jgi:nitrogen fixation/metabolism regulation signal transduction histidine kinase
VLASTEPWRVGAVDPDAAAVRGSGAGTLGTGGALVHERRPPAARGAEEPDGRSETLVFVALRSSPTQAMLKAGHESGAAWLVARQMRALSWTQAVAALVMLALALLFARWVLRPYRALREAAAQIPSPLSAGSASRTDDPEDLVASFRGVIDKIRGQEEEIDRLRTASREGAALSQEMLDGLTSGVLILGPDARVKALNPAGEAILGRPRTELLGHEAREVFAGSPELLSLLRDGVESGRAHAREVVACARPGMTPAHLGVTVSALPQSADSGGGVFCIFSDLTEIRGLQEKVRLRESLAGLGAMSAGIAHEFRNALATILGYARLIDREAREGTPGAAARPRTAEHAAAIAREVEGVSRIVDDFLRYARPARLQLSSWNPRSMVEDVAREVLRDAACPGLSIQVEGEWPPAVTADEGLLRQAFQNLLRNAAEALGGAGGAVSVIGRLDPDGSQWRVEINDSGPGIPAEVLDRLFTPFVTTKEHGTGLGLAMAQKAVVCHDGGITAANAAEGGARVTLTLPRVLVAADAAAASVHE